MQPWCTYAPESAATAQVVSFGLLCLSERKHARMACTLRVCEAPGSSTLAARVDARGEDRVVDSESDRVRAPVRRVQEADEQGTHDQ